MTRPPDKGGGASLSKRGRGVPDEKSAPRSSPEKEAIGVIGLGTMGSAMATNLVPAGFRVHGFDVLAAQREELKKAGGMPATSTAAVAQLAEVLITSLPSAAALHAVAEELLGKGRVVMETSTLPIADKERARDTLAKKGIVLLDCPLSGTGAQARAKDLVVFVSGDEAAFRKIEPYLPGFSRAHYFLGAFGNGSKMKFVANLLVAIHNVSTAEAFVLGMKAGLDPKTIYEVMANSAGASRMFQVRGPQKVWRIGVLETIARVPNAANFEAFIKGMRDVGYVETKNLLVDYRSGDGQAERFAALADELVRAKVDLILTRGTPAALTAAKATRTIPIVMAAIGEPLGRGIVASLAHPGGNVTGLSSFVTELTGKRLEVLQALRKMSRVATLLNMSNPIFAAQWKETQLAGEKLG